MPLTFPFFFVLLGGGKAYLFNMVNYGNLSSPRIKIGILFKLAKRSNQHLHAHDKLGSQKKY